jgi:hypothetical protein
MITKDSKLKDLVKILTKKGACGQIEVLNKMINRSAAATVDDLYKQLAISNVSYLENWSRYLIRTVGRELDPSIRKRAMTRITTPEYALSLLQEENGCDFFTEEEHEILKSKFEGKLPEQEKEIKEGNIKLVNTKAKAGDIGGVQ